MKQFYHRSSLFNSWCLLLGLFTVCQVEASNWLYGPDGSDEGWPTNCKTGMYQSPIDLSPSKSVTGYLGVISFIGYENKYGGVIKNTGHSIEVKLDTNDIFVKDGGLNGTFKLEQLHFHWTSEHTISGNRFGAEVHFVHRNIAYDSVAEAVKHKNGIAVVGVLFHLSPFDSPVLNFLIDNAEDLFDSPGKTKPLNKMFSPSLLLPHDKEGLFRYRGSLTTPTCDESVIWTVFTESLTISESQIERLQAVKSDHGELKANNRPVKMQNTRVVVYQKSNTTPHVFAYNASTCIHMNAAMLLVILSNAFIGKMLMF